MLCEVACCRCRCSGSRALLCAALSPCPSSGVALYGESAPAALAAGELAPAVVAAAAAPKGDGGGAALCLCDDIRPCGRARGDDRLRARRVARLGRISRLEEAVLRSEQRRASMSVAAWLSVAGVLRPGFRPVGSHCLRLSPPSVAAQKASEGAHGCLHRSNASELCRGYSAPSSERAEMQQTVQEATGGSRRSKAKGRASTGQQAHDAAMRRRLREAARFRSADQITQQAWNQ